MKSLLFVCLFAVAFAEPEADPQLLYSNLGLGLTYAASPLAYSSPLVYNNLLVGKSAPCVNADNVPVPCAQINAVAPVHYIGKREAEAEADPQLLYSGLGLNYPLTYAATPLAYNSLLIGKSAPCVNAANVPVPCAGVNAIAPVAPVHYIGKREAEAEPEADPQLLYSNLALPYAAAPLAYAHAPLVAPRLVHSSLLGVCTNYLGVQVPC